MRDQLCRQRRKGALTHIDRGYGMRVRQRSPVEIGGQFTLHIGTGDELHAARGVTARQRDA